jgi:hypothetical protein
VRALAIGIPREAVVRADGAAPGRKRKGARMPWVPDQHLLKQIERGAGDPLTLVRFARMPEFRRFQGAVLEQRRRSQSRPGAATR